MSESHSHRRAKKSAAGPQGRVEVKQRGGTRLDARSRSKATEVERSGQPAMLERAANRLRKEHASQKVLQVPQHDMPKARHAMRKVGVKGTVKNMSGTKRNSV